MLAGEPPVTGATAQAMIAKLMTERPVHLRVVRGSVPDNIDAAVAKALAKTPADRFASAGEFSRALELKPITGTVPVASSTLAAAREVEAPTLDRHCGGGTPGGAWRAHSP